MITFFKICLYITLAWWTLKETGPVTIALFALVIVDLSITKDGLVKLTAAHNAGVSKEAYELKKHLDKYNAGGK